MPRNCIIRKLYAAGTPYIQVAGFIFTCGMIYQTNQTALADVKDLKDWKEKTIPLFSAMQQEVHDIHEWVKEDRANDR